MSSFLDNLLSETPDGEKEKRRADLRVAVTEGLLLRMQQRGVTKAQLAATIGVTRSAISQMLASSRNLSLNTIADIAVALDLIPAVSFVPLGTSLSQRQTVVGIPTAGSSHAILIHVSQSPSISIPAIDPNSRHVKRPNLSSSRMAPARKRAGLRSSERIAGKQRVQP